MSQEGERSTGAIALAPTLKLLGVDAYVVDGQDRGAHLRLAQGRARVGTASGVELALSDPTVSRLHCELRVGRDRVSIVDAGSTNGTWIGGVRVRDADIVASTDVRVGQSTLRIELGQSPAFVQLSTQERCGALVGSSVEMRRIYAVLDRIAPSDASVLVTGETGTGKEVVARTLHEMSRRREGPFVTVDCGTIAANLVESELFGHVRGAFSGAFAERRGVVEAAAGGTVFFDEIGDLPLALQPKLLRLLEAREVRPVGSNTARKVDVRVVAATHRPLARSVNEGTFREDLYYRLAVVEIELPPLRVRREDIAPLATEFYRRFTTPAAELPGDLLAVLQARSWPGNVRELRNFVERSVLLGWPRPEPVGEPGRNHPAPGATSVAAVVSTQLPLKDARAAWIEQFESLYVRALLAETGGNVTRAAEVAGLHRRSLQRIMARMGLRGEADDERASADGPEEA
jgi:transcriptional regulator with PAS, ATPase and Fis domain